MLFKQMFKLLLEVTNHLNKVWNKLIIELNLTLLTKLFFKLPIVMFSNCNFLTKCDRG